MIVSLHGAFAAGQADRTGTAGRTSTFNATGLPIVDEQVTFSLLVDDAGRAEDKWIFPILEEQTNVKVDLMIFPHQIALERKSILLSAGDYPDVIGGWILPANEVMTLGMVEGVYIPLDGLFEQYAPRIMEVLDLPAVRQTMTLPDGHIYSIPYIVSTPLVSYLPWINTEWLERVNKEVPTTVDEFIDVLRAFRDMDANGSGRSNDEIPYSVSVLNSHWTNLAGGWFGLPVSDDGFTMDDGELVFGAAREEYKQGIIVLNRMFREGLIDPEAFTQDGDMWKAKIQNNLVGVMMAYGPGDFIPSREDGQQGAYVPLPVLRANDSVQPQFHRSSYGSFVFNRQVVVTDRAAQPEVIVRWWDNLFQLENSVSVAVGPIGKVVERLNGNFRRLPQSLLTDEERVTYEWGNLYTQSLPRYMPLDVRVLPVEGEPIPFDDKIAADTLYEAYLNEMVPRVWSSQEDAERLSVLTTDITNYITQKRAEWITGQADINAEWDAYLARLDALGLPELMEIRQRALDTVQR